MNKGILENVLAVVLGAAAGIGLIWLGEYLMPVLFPAFRGIDESDHDAIAKAIANMPPGAFVFLLANYAFASFAGGAVATLVSKGIKKWPQLAVGILLTIAGILNLVFIHHPLWFTVCNIVEYLPLAYCGYLITRKKNVS